MIFRDQTTETLGKVSVLSAAHLPNGNQDVLIRPKLYQQARVPPSQDQPSHYPWLGLAVTPEDQALHFFFHHYVVPESGRSPTHPDCHGIIYKRATEPGYLADLINAVGLAGLAYSKNAPMLIDSAREAFSRALRGICTALVDPSEAASDQMLVAVMLLALYETVSFSSDKDLSSWSRHVDGALALIQLRGAGQLRNRIGRSIFLNLRTEVLIDCLQRGLLVPKVLIDLMAEARTNETEQEQPAARLANIIVNICDAIPSTDEDITGETGLPCYVTRLLAIDADLEGWSQTLPVEYEYKARTTPSGLTDAEMFMGRYHIYQSVEVANTWNLQRCARVILRQAIVKAISNRLPISFSLSILSSFPMSYTDLLPTSETIIQQNSSDVCYSVPYILHSVDQAGKSSELRAAYAVHLLWPLYVAGTTRTASDALRDWVVSAMENIKDVTGIQKAKHIVLSLQRRGSELSCQDNTPNQADHKI
ncbi:hypothetical protein FPANT_2934 [Fusarium pseudoanthophilum]|uniref:Uncharacterized protein n=1 Tax=Fusarium pseudoanthophilum TaxID=48495 RepID=A0A8H5UUQ0_9HYPO|nr:hypothetical protein FPANT_2934 [Fusarium pseudoanthophilum]